MIIGKKLREIIKEEKLTFRGIAQEIGVDHASLCRSLKEGANPEWKTIEKLLDYLGYDFKLIKRKEVKPVKTKASRLMGKRKEKGL
jgi:transcriptional regulator with XRE-family HTH domain